MGAGSVVALGALVLRVRGARRRGRDPLVVTSIFSHRAYTAGLGSILAFFSAMSGTLSTLTLFLQFGEHFSAIHAGLTLAPFAFGAAVGAGLAGAVLAPRFGRPVLQVAAAVFGVGVWWLRHLIAVHGLHTGSATIALPELCSASASGCSCRPCSTSCSRRSPRRRSGPPQACSTPSSSSPARSGSPCSGRSSSACSITPGSSPRSSRACSSVGVHRAGPRRAVRPPAPSRSRAGRGGPPFGDRRARRAGGRAIGVPCRRSSDRGAVPAVER